MVFSQAELKAPNDKESPQQPRNRYNQNGCVTTAAIIEINVRAHRAPTVRFNSIQAPAASIPRMSLRCCFHEPVSRAHPRCLDLARMLFMLIWICESGFFLFHFRQTVWHRDLLGLVFQMPAQSSVISERTRCMPADWRHPLYPTRLCHCIRLEANRLDEGVEPAHVDHLCGLACRGIRRSAPYRLPFACRTAFGRIGLIAPMTPSPPPTASPALTRFIAAPGAPNTSSNFRPLSFADF